MNKKAIAILGGIFILIVATLGFLIFNRSSNDTTEETTTETPIVEEAPVVEEPIEPQEPATLAVRVTDEAVLAPVLFYQGNGISYFNAQGQLFQTDLTISEGQALLSNKRELTIQQKSNISKILWPLTGNSFIAETGSAGKPSWSFYDSNSASYKDIPGQIYSLDWMPSGDKIIYTWVNDNGKADLSIANPDATGFQKLTDFFFADNIIAVSPDGQKVLFYRNQNTDTTKNNINMVSIDGKTFTAPVNEGYNSGVLWSPDSRKFLFGKRDSASQRYGLWVADVSTGETRNLSVSTIVSKAVWSKDGQTVFVGVPVSGTAGQGLTQDVLYRIDVASGQQTQYDPGLAVDARDLFLSANNEVLFFRNAQDNYLYYIPL
jgi:hypothetical protein